MAAQLRVVRRRIRTVQSTQKITRAFELISASRLVRAQQRVDASRPYTNLITQALTSVANTEVTVSHALLESRAEIKAAGVLVVTSDRGLAGPYNANVLRTAAELMARLQADGVEPRLYVTGRKGVAYYRFRRRELADSWAGVADRPDYDDAKQVADTMLQAFLDHEVDDLHIVFTDFVSTGTQRAVAQRIIPLVVEETTERPPEPIPMYIYEPDAQGVLDALLPRYVEARVFTAMLEAAASEHAARRRAMKAATDNANELIEDLTREYNQARQAQITQEIMEIVGGAEALQTTGS
ncbi:MAG TPA: F0F1 ATP synthase subunit gamma [Actinomycetota bacterium]|jgi:F-type H+-transporting ATPase subunit gamma|nr:F0F1 ATP synthase subunit gamma [Actinomycetota bacterium]